MPLFRTSRVLTAERVADRLERLLSRAERAQARNPRNAGTLSPTPTIATSTSFNAALTNQYLPETAKEAAYSVFGGLISYSAGLTNIRGSISSAGTADNNYWRVETMVDADVVAARIRAGSTAWLFRVLVDDQPVDTGFSLGLGNTTYEHQLTFASKAVRKIAVEGHLRSLFGGFVVGPTSSLSRPPEPPFRIWWNGDSYSAGTGTTANWNSVSRVACDWLGVTDVWSAAAGGTGYSLAGFDNFSTRSHLVTDAAPDVIVFQSGYNDRNSSAASVTAGALAVFRDARARAPAAPIFVFGAWPGTLGTAAVTATETAIQDAVTQFGDPYCRFIPCTNDAAGPWLFGTGRVGATNGSGNTDFYIGSDAVHPGDAGAAYLGRMCADGIRRAAQQMLTTL